MNQEIDIDKLPEAAQRELLTFYEFLIFKYFGQQETFQNNKQQILTTIFQEATGKLPAHYTFKREELNARILLLVLGQFISCCGTNKCLYEHLFRRFKRWSKD